MSKSPLLHQRRGQGAAGAAEGAGAARAEAGEAVGAGVGDGGGADGAVEEEGVGDGEVTSATAAYSLRAARTGSSFRHILSSTDSHSRPSLILPS